MNISGFSSASNILAHAGLQAYSQPKAAAGKVAQSDHDGDHGIEPGMQTSLPTSVQPGKGQLIDKMG